MKWCTLQACSLLRHVAAEVRRQARLVLGLGGSLWGAGLPLVHLPGSGSSLRRAVQLVVVHGPHAHARVRRFGPAGGQGSWDTWRHHAVKFGALTRPTTACCSPTPGAADSFGDKPGILLLVSGCSTPRRTQPSQAELHQVLYATRQGPWGEGPPLPHWACTSSLPLLVQTARRHRSPGRLGAGPCGCARLQCPSS